jgi:peptidoglycan/LPS O-acetylase OafA/YrhL
MQINGKNHFTNNFDFLRLIGALMVIFSHSFPLTGNNNRESLLFLTGSKLTFGTLGVIIFFVISGYLIAKSWYNNPYIIKFLWNRLLRIVPGLMGVTLVSIFIIGPLVTSYNIINYFTDPMTLSYLENMTIFSIHFTLPGVFVNNPYPDAVNGSIWTLPIEFLMYIFILVIGFFGILHKKKYVLFITLFISVLYIIFISDNYIYGKPLISLYGQFYVSLLFDRFLHSFNNYIFLSTFFLIGATYYVYKNINFNKYVALLLFILWILSFNNIFFYLVSLISLPYITLYLALTKLPYLNNVGKYGDFSYGLYIYAFLIQQTIVHFINGISVIQLFILSALITFPFAYFSWTFIESRALKLKNTDPLKIFS